MLRVRRGLPAFALVTCGGATARRDATARGVFATAILATNVASACAPTEALPTCAGFDKVTVATLPGVIDEASGLVVSTQAPQVLWLHNDGDDGRLFAVDRSGALLATVTLPTGAVVDAEDLALQILPDGREIAWVGDIGDNDAVRDEIGVIAVRLPALEGLPPQAVIEADADRFRLRYPDGPRDAEALVFDPDGALVVITKGEPTEMFRATLPLAAEGVGTLEPLGTIVTQGPITGAALQDDLLAVRTTLSALYGPWTPMFDGTTACAATLPDAPTDAGEAIAWRPDGLALLVTHEGIGAVVSELVATGDTLDPRPAP